MPVRLPAIQAVRAAAALMVVAAHVKIAIEIELFRIPIPDLPLSPFPLVAGVDVFFVVSGFVMAYASGSLFGQQGAWKRFLWRRLVRIVPLYWLITIALLALMFAIRSPILDHTTAWQIAASFLFVPALNPDGFPVPLLDVGWTLNYEMAFYVVFALFIGWRRPLALAATACALLLLVAIRPFVDPSATALRFWSDPIVIEFLGGILLQLLVRRGLILSPWTRLLMIGTAVVILATFPALDQPWRWLQWGGPALLVVAAAVCGPVAFGRWTTTVERLGDLSYALYLVHFFAIRAVAQVARHLEWTAAPTTVGAFAIATTAIALLLAWVLHVGFERPVLQRLRRYDRVRTPPVVPTS
ncbi:peptidoglycan/LPS O-acetylase OafA/YrhL [Aureimonas jatrophae]|uniref:Peptidoglycan/LPS O-acetylase OafA/YrhL, contains acyltransferase and SGNH-hydrolase domains n=1 Tax=Aureimonas jatrophae TaxID=1166073 RepID=A0A1H0GM26_9HYPH|nr:peptidoglycan/LPS O-acetylase OafA/YrhL [Aureimonas jatrophae]SDO07935.1 Peptidoglycan/LPS O-acetylase OafA/YrhL, contains acyltransferase and SGNH-hydrolase domains [Aureimonas jatrophae]